MRKYSQEKFIMKARQVHGDRYDYSQSIYIDSQTKICIICPDHGPFWQSPAEHLRGKGCKKCRYEQMRQNRQDQHIDRQAQFIARAKTVHGDRYDYSKVEYKGCDKPVCIVCPDHGEFWQTPTLHQIGHGCPKCNKNRAKTKEEFIEEANIIHNNKYDYSQVEYERGDKKVCIICPIHGLFWQSFTKHVAKKHGCPKCSVIQRSKTQTMSKEEFAARAAQIHGEGRYDYSLVNFSNLHDKVQIRCIKHNHVFTQIAADHLDGHGCPKCGTVTSNSEAEIADYIRGLNVEIELRNRKILENGFELDIYIPSLHIAIEYDGLIWHSDKFKEDRYYHLRKTEECIKSNIRLLHIFEDEYNEHPDIVKAKLRHLLHKTDNLPRVGARKCQVSPISMKEAKEFLNTNHIQGFNGAKVYLGAFYQDRLVGVMSFKEWKKGEWELARFATDINLHCVGLGGKLFAYFIRNYDFSIIKSFADRRWTPISNNNLYTRLGFTLQDTLKPDYSYVHRNGKIREHKFNCRKTNLLKKYPDSGLTKAMTESEMVQQLGFYRIWDCGLYRYVYTKQG